MLGSGHWLAYTSDHMPKGLEVKFELTFIVVDNVLATWVMTEPGPVYYIAYCC